MKSRILMSLFAIPMMIACGSSDGDSGINSGVDPTKSASEVTDEEAEQICEAVTDYTAAQVTLADQCKVTGITGGAIAYVFGGDTAGACQEAVDECKDNPPETEETDCSGATAPDGCDATVGEVEDCYAAFAQAYGDVFDSLPSCANLETWLDENSEVLESEGDSLEVDLNDIPECADLPEACLQ